MTRREHTAENIFLFGLLITSIASISCVLKLIFLIIKFDVSFFWSLRYYGLAGVLGVIISVWGMGLDNRGDK